MPPESDQVPIWQLIVAVLAAPAVIALVAAIVAGALSLPELALATAAWIGGIVLGTGVGFGILVGLPLALWRLRSARQGVLAWTAMGAVSGLAVALIIIAAIVVTAQDSLITSGSLLMLGATLLVGTAALTAALSRGILHVIRSL